MGWLSSSQEEQDGVVVEGCYVHAVTANAVLITPMDGDEKLWVPKSVIVDPDADEIKKWDEDLDITVKSWFAKKNNL